MTLLYSLLALAPLSLPRTGWGEIPRLFLAPLALATLAAFDALTEGTRSPVARSCLRPALALGVGLLSALLAGDSWGTGDLWLGVLLLLPFYASAGMALGARLGPRASPVAGLLFAASYGLAQLIDGAWLINPVVLAGEGLVRVYGPGWCGTCKGALLGQLGSAWLVLLPISWLLRATTRQVADGPCPQRVPDGDSRWACSE